MTATTQRRVGRPSKLWTLGNEAKSIGQWAIVVGIGASTIRKRLTRSWTLHEALSIPALEAGRQLGKDIQ
jgi:hypothetical protein